jgi:hypothetical protein
MGRHLVPFPPGMKPPVVPALGEDERKAALRATAIVNHDDEAFQKWLDTHKLRRQKKEVDVDFARRVFLAIKKSMVYKRPFDHDGKATSTCQAGRGDCGCLSTVFVAALRANNIPARELSGRLVKTEKPFDKCEYGIHVRTEFFAEGVGWVPADPTYGLGDRSRLGLNFFGNDVGDLLVSHIDGELLVEHKLAGKTMSLPRLQSAHYHGLSISGNFENSETKESWQIRELPLDPKKK